MGHRVNIDKDGVPQQQCRWKRRCLERDLEHHGPATATRSKNYVSTHPNSQQYSDIESGQNTDNNNSDKENDCNDDDNLDDISENYSDGESDAMDELIDSNKANQTISVHDNGRLNINQKTVTTM